jgi:hypothetical protein
VTVGATGVAITGTAVGELEAVDDKPHARVTNINIRTNFRE